MHSVHVRKQCKIFLYNLLSLDRKTVCVRERERGGGCGGWRVVERKQQHTNTRTWYYESINICFLCRDIEKSIFLSVVVSQIDVFHSAVYIFLFFFRLFVLMFQLIKWSCWSEFSPLPSALFNSQHEFYDGFAACAEEFIARVRRMEERRRKTVVGG